MIVNLNLII